MSADAQRLGVAARRHTTRRLGSVVLSVRCCPVTSARCCVTSEVVDAVETGGSRLRGSALNAWEAGDECGGQEAYGSATDRSLRKRVRPKARTLHILASPRGEGLLHKLADNDHKYNNAGLSCCHN